MSVTANDQPVISTFEASSRRLLEIAEVFTRANTEYVTVKTEDLLNVASVACGHFNFKYLADSVKQ